MAYPIALFAPSGRRDGSTLAPAHHRLPLERILAMFCVAYDCTRKYDAPLIFLGDAEHGRARCSEYAPIVPIDIDDAPIGWAPPVDAAGVAYTTASSRPDAPRWRVLVVLDRPPARAEFRAIVRAAATRLGLPHDACTESGSQGVYPPITGATIVPLVGLAWSADELVAEGGGIKDGDRTRVGMHATDDDAEPRHPMPIEQRAALWRRTVGELRLPARARTTSGTLRGATAFRVIHRCVIAAVALGLPRPCVVAALLVAVGAHGQDWRVDEIDDAVAGAWTSTSIVGWESALPTAGPLIVPTASATARGERAGRLIIGPPGSGKTTRVVDELAADAAAAVLWVVPRSKLAADAAARTGATLYATPGHEHARRVATTFHSAHKYAARRWSIVVIDEIAATVDSIDARSWGAVASVCAAADRVIAIGADVDAEVHGLAQQLAGRQLEVELVAAPPMQRELVILHRNRVVPMLLADYPGPIFVGCDRAREARALGAMLRARGKRVAVCVGGDDDAALPTDSTVRTHDAVVCTHAVAEAINITAPVHRVFVIHAFAAVHRDTLVQLASRCRAVDHPTIIVGEIAWALGVPATARQLAERIAALGGDPCPAGALAARWRADQRKADAAARPSLAWTSTYPITHVDLTDPGPGTWAREYRAWWTFARDDDAQELVDALPWHERLPVRPTREQRAGAQRVDMERHGLPVDLDHARRDLSGGLRSAVRRRGLADIAGRDARALRVVCERLEPRATADRQGLEARARMDAAFLAAELEHVAGDAERWYAWLRDRRRSLAAAGERMPALASVMRRVDQWRSALARAPAAAVASWVESVLPRDSLLRRGAAPAPAVTA